MLVMGTIMVLFIQKKKRSLKVWSPVAKEIELELVKKDGSREFIDLHYLTTGNWQAVVYEDLEGVKYRYRVRVNESFKTTTDPYAIASTANGEYNYVVDKKKFRKFKHPKPEFSGKSVDAIIYEASIRDLTSSKTSKAVNKGKFKGLLENHKNEGINYIASLGVTHIQLLPIYDFEGVDEKDQFKRYNWGYNPSQYNVVEGSFATDPDDPYKRINELIELIDYIHSKGMRVSMDVVYNHVYNVKTFSMEASCQAILLDMMKVVCELLLAVVIMMLQLKEGKYIDLLLIQSNIGWKHITSQPLDLI